VLSNLCMCSLSLLVMPVVVISGKSRLLAAGLLRPEPFMRTTSLGQVVCPYIIEYASTACKS
jgi:hypothetical protein